MKSLVEYMEKRVMPTLMDANKILREVFQSDISLEFSEPQFSSSLRGSVIDIYACCPEKTADKIARFSLCRKWEWWVAFSIYESWYWQHFRDDNQQPPLSRKFLPFALASYAYARCNIFPFYEDIFYPPHKEIIFVTYSIENSIPKICFLMNGVKKEHSYRLSLSFKDEHSVLSLYWRGFSCERCVPYGDYRLRMAMVEIAKSCKLNCV